MRKHYIDYLRAIAILAVIAAHCAGAVFYSEIGANGKLSWWVSNILLTACFPSVPIFVMISGAVILGRTMSTGGFYRNRFVRLLPPIMFWSLFYIAFHYVVGGMDIGELIKFAKKGLIYEGSAYYHMWYLSMFVWLMMFAPFINMFVNGDKPTSREILILLGVMSIFFILNGVATAALEVWGTKIEWFKGFPWFMAYFIGGYYFEKYGGNINVNNMVIIASVSLLILGGAVINYYAKTAGVIYKYNFILDNAGPLLVMTTPLIFLFFKSNATWWGESKIIAHISEASFGMYLIHPIFLHIVQKTLVSLTSIPVIYILFTFALTALPSYVSIMLIRKNSFMRALC